MLRIHTYVRLSALFFLFHSMPALHAAVDFKKDLVQAIKQNNFDKVQKCIDQVGNLNTITDDKKQPLLFLALEAAGRYKKDPGIVKLLLKGANPNLTNATGEPFLYAAIKTDIVGLVELLLQEDVDPNTTNAPSLGEKLLEGARSFANYQIKNEDRDPPLFIAMQQKDSALMMVKLLLEHGANPNTPNLAGELPLEVAVTKNDTEIAALLLENKNHKKENVNHKNRKGNPLLHVAINNDNADMVKLLLKHGADPDAKNIGGETPLYAAMSAEKASKGMVEALLHFGADPNIANTAQGLAGLFRQQENQDGERPIERVIREDNTEIAKLLLEIEGKDHWGNEKKKVDLTARNADGEIPLHAAILKLSTGIEMTQLLLKNGADPNIKNKEGDTGLHIAMGARSEGRYQFIKLLLENGADPNIKDDNQLTVLSEAVTKNNTKLAALLLKKLANPNALDLTGNPLLHAAIQKKNTPMLVLLLKLGADPDAKNIDGETPLYAAMKAKASQKMLKALLHFGADPNIASNGERPIERATREDNTEIAKLLLEIEGKDYWGKEKKKVNLEARNADGQAPLHATIIQSPTTAIMKLLFQNGADANIINREGKTGLHVALELKNKNLGNKKLEPFIKLLIENKADIDKLDNNLKTALQNFLNQGQGQGKNISLEDHHSSNEKAIFYALLLGASSLVYVGWRSLKNVATTKPTKRNRNKPKKARKKKAK